MRMTVLLFALVWLLAPAAAGPASPSSKKASLKATKLKEARPFNYQLPEGRTAATTQHALVGKVARRKLTLVDVDGDGRFDEEGVDGWSLGSYGYLLPFEQPFIFGNLLVRIKLGEKGKSLLWNAQRIRGRPLDLRELALINGSRMRNGLPPCGYNAELSAGCRQHCLYMGKHGMTHNEDASLAGYSEAGEKAGRASNISDGWQGAGSGAFRQFYHRRTVAHQDTRTMGFGASAGYCCVDGISDRSVRRWQWPIIIPAPGTHNHPLSFDHMEKPRAVPRTPAAGYPITLRWARGTPVTDVWAKMYDEKGKKVRLHISSPEKPAAPSIPSNNDSICLLPAIILTPGKTYRVEVKANVAGKPYERSFEFSTSKRAKR